MIPSLLMTALKEGFQFLGGKLDAIKSAFENAEKKETLSESMDTQTKVFATMAGRIESSLDKLRQIEVKSDVTIDTSVLEADLAEILKDIGSLKIPDTKNIEASLKMIYNCIDAGNSDMKLCMSELTTAINAISLAVPSTFSIDPNQMRALTVANTSMPMRAEIGIATRVSNTTVTITNSSTEATYQFPGATVGWQIKIRDQGTLGYYSWITGKLPGSGDGSTFVTIPQNFVRSQQGVDYSGKTIYLGAEAAAIYEIEVFRQ